MNNTEKQNHRDIKNLFIVLALAIACAAIFSLACLYYCDSDEPKSLQVLE
jgi:hypothetical protein